MNDADLPPKGTSLPKKIFLQHFISTVTHQIELCIFIVTTVTLNLWFLWSDIGIQICTVQGCVCNEGNATTTKLITKEVYSIT